MQPLPVPFLKITANLFPDIEIKLKYQTGFLEYRDKFSWTDPSELSVVPTAKRFGTDDPSGADIHLRLVPDLYLSGLFGSGQPADDVGGALTLFPLIGIVEFISVLFPAAHSLFGDTGKVKHMVNITQSVVLRRKNIYTAAHLNTVLFAPVGKVAAHGINDRFVIVAYFFFAADVAQHCEMIAVKPCDRFVFRESRFCFFCPEPQQIISCRSAENLVDIFEIRDIGIGKQIGDIRMLAQQLGHASSKALQTERARQRVVLCQPAQFFLVLPADSTYSLDGNDRQRDEKQ